MPAPVSDTWHLPCRLRLFQARTHVHTVLITNMAFELGWFNPSVIETMVDQVVQAFHLTPAKLVWLEHYASDEPAISTAPFSQVVFEWQDGKATNPQWLAIAPEIAQDLVSETLRMLPA